MGIETRRLALARKKNAPPFFSHEFVIQNHGDITSCLLMIVFVGFMFPATMKLASIFILPQYNETVVITEADGATDTRDMYRVGLRDVFTVVFYSIACVTVHAIIQEYILDKIQRKVHLSKSKQTKFSESGQLLVFSLGSVVHAAFVIQEFMPNYEGVKNIWLNYPDQHKFLNLRTKIFFLFQLSYWLHQLPEFYLQKLKREEIRARLIPFFIHFVAIAAGYTMNFHRFTVVVLTLEYSLATLFHFARLAYFLEKKTIAQSSFRAWNVFFVVIRLLVTVLSVFVFWYTLRQSEAPYIDVEAGNFNTAYTRMHCLIGLLTLQLYQLWNFLSFHLGRFRESRSRKQKKTQEITLVKKGKKKVASSEEEEDQIAPPKQTPMQKKKN